MGYFVQFVINMIFSFICGVTQGHIITGYKKERIPILKISITLFVTSMMLTPEGLESLPYTLWFSLYGVFIGTMILKPLYSG